MIPSKVKRYLNETTNISVSILQYYYNFPQRYRAKCKDLVRKTRQANVEELIRKIIGRWETEAETFRGIGLDQLLKVYQPKVLLLN